MLTIPEIINIAKISGYLAHNAVDANGVFVFGSLDKDLPKKIYMENSSLVWAYNQNYIAARATGAFSIEGTNTLGGIIQVKVQDPVLGLITLCNYTLVAGDTTNTIIAAHVAAAIAIYGYTATSSGSVVTVSAPLSLGGTINGVSLIVSLLPANAIAINLNDILLINSTDTLLYG